MIQVYAPSCILVAVVFALVACAPVLDWREVYTADGELLALFPCKPKVHARPVALAGFRVRMNLTACAAGATTYALAYATIGDPAKVTAALEELRDAAAANIEATARPGTAWRVPGMTLNVRAEKLQLQGRGADGQPVREEVVFFAKGTRVYQATVVGSRIDLEAADTFFAGLKLNA